MRNRDPVPVAGDERAVAAPPGVRDMAPVGPGGAIHRLLADRDQRLTDEHAEQHYRRGT